MRGMFGNTPGGKLGLYALGLGLLLFLLAATFFAVRLLGAEDTRADTRVERATSPTVAQSQQTQAPESETGPETGPGTKPENTGPTEAEKAEAKKAEAKKAEEAAKKKEAEEQAAAEQAAAEQTAAEQVAEESWREAAEAREEPIPEEAVGTEQPAPEQPAAPVAPASAALSLSVPAAGVYNAPVTDSVAESVLSQGAGKMPATGFPWQPGSNTYIAGHVYGYEGTGSWQLFAGLPNVGAGSEILLTDANGTTYTYQVTETLVVAPTDVWVADPIPGQTTVSLQTCTGPGWSQRMVVRGVLV